MQLREVVRVYYYGNHGLVVRRKFCLASARYSESNKLKYARTKQWRWTNHMREFSDHINEEEVYVLFIQVDDIQLFYEIVHAGRVIVI